ncbi:MAG: hydroxymethylglutaryl-CoA lyase [Myxococcales bacterium]|nr:hydroxymethylglutaryl-CoA lyase [Myxococcales bacterium]MCB9648892.1 hydroxymethylglutaryl-CoA lyase [Deltaproteobacteria bacterium]
MGEVIRIHEVGLRDGLQNEAAFVPTDEKVRLAGMLADAGLTRIELTSFVSPRWIPQLADAAMVAEQAPRVPGVRYSALVPNLRGLEGAKAAGLDAVAIFLSASEAHSKKNINKSIAEALEVLEEVARAAKAEGMWVRGYVSTVFGCPYEGAVDPAVPVRIVERLFDVGIDEVSLGDTIGVANPRQVRDIVGRLQAILPLDRIALHMHDTRGTALANVLAGLDLGVTIFDSAFGGLGGCPYAPGASGNLATEDLVYMLEGMGYETGVDLEKLILASEHVAELVSRTLPSKVLQSELGKRIKDRDRAARSR